VSKDRIHLSIDEFESSGKEGHEENKKFNNNMKKKMNKTFQDNIQVNKKMNKPLRRMICTMQKRKIFQNLQSR
jgi:hypothetical protein